MPTELRSANQDIPEWPVRDEILRGPLPYDETGQLEYLSLTADHHFRRTQAALIRLRIAVAALKSIHSDVVPAGYDSGHAGIERKVNEALAIIGDVP